MLHYTHVEATTTRNIRLIYENCIFRTLMKAKFQSKHVLQKRRLKRIFRFKVPCFVFYTKYIQKTFMTVSLDLHV